MKILAVLQDVSHHSVAEQKMEIFRRIMDGEDSSKSSQKYLKTKFQIFEREVVLQTTVEETQFRLNLRQSLQRIAKTEAEHGSRKEKSVPLIQIDQKKILSGQEEETERPEEETGPISVPPCNVTATEGLNSTANPSSWSEIQAGQWLAIDGLTDISYASIELDNESEVVVDERLDYECGYTYSVKVPAGYNASNEYPLFLYLHGQLLDSVFFNNMMTNNFHIPDDDRYIIVRPSKLEIDWDPKKALDVLEDVKANLNVDDDRVYLTGLSMGGRGTFIVAAALPDYFAAIMPLTPHHEPYSYLPLAEDIAHLPVWMSHGTNDSTSEYSMAAQMAENLSNLGAEIEFQTVVGGEHGGWFAIYSDPEIMQWMLSHTRGE